MPIRGYPNPRQPRGSEAAAPGLMVCVPAEIFCAFRRVNDLRRQNGTDRNTMRYRQAQPKRKANRKKPAGAPDHRRLVAFATAGVCWVCLYLPTTHALACTEWGTTSCHLAPIR